MASLENFIGKKVLITTQNWFYGKDGKQYKACHGTLIAIHEAGKTLGFIPNRAHANWFVEVGDMIIMGCQVMYINQVDSVEYGDVEDWATKESSCNKFTRPSAIYNLN
jgi:hypothetical protein